MNRAFSAGASCSTFTGALPQALMLTAPSALNRCGRQLLSTRRARREVGGVDARSDFFVRGHDNLGTVPDVPPLSHEAPQHYSSGRLLSLSARELRSSLAHWTESAQAAKMKCWCRVGDFANDCETFRSRRRSGVGRGLVSETRLATSSEGVGLRMPIQTFLKMSRGLRKRSGLPRVLPTMSHLCSRDKIHVSISQFRRSVHLLA